MSLSNPLTTTTKAPRAAEAHCSRIPSRYAPAALKALVKKSEGGKFGARDLRRVIRKAVEDPAAEKLIDGTLASGSTLVVDADENGEIVLN